MWITDQIIKCIPDSLWLKYIYRKTLKKPLNLKNPQTFNEKLQWLKLHDRNPLYTQMVDKYGVRMYIKEKIGEEYLIPLVGGPWNTFDDIDFTKLPDQFVLKCTHDSGSVVICTDKNTFDMNAAKKKLNRALKGNFYYGGREWPYKNVKPRIIAEKFISDGIDGDISDYKLHCFNGQVKLILVCRDRNQKNGVQKVFYDWEWNRLEVKRPDALSDIEVSRPKLLYDMISIAEMFSKDISFLRVDLYEISGKLYFGEFTFFPAGGFERFVPDEWDLKMGNWLKLVNSSLKLDTARFS